MALSPTTSRGSSTSGALTLISSSVLGASAATITLSAIPGTYTALHLLLGLRSTAASTGDTALLQLNGDATVANYITGRTLNNKGTSSVLQQSGSAGVFLDIPGASVGAGYFGLWELCVMGYASTTYNKTVSGDGAFFDGTGTIACNTGAIWKSTAIVTSLVCAVVTGPNFLTGSYMYLYGET